MNVVFYAILVLAFLGAAAFGTPAEVGKAALDSSKTAVNLAIGLVGYMSLFLGLMKIVEESGGLAWMAKTIRPVLVRIFPDVPADHPAMGAMVMNIAANALGLGNAATPFGLKAMKELQELNPDKDTASDAMVRLLALNTSGLALLPTGVIGLRALKDSVDPAAIFPTTLMATGLSTAAGLTAAFVFAGLGPFRASARQRDASDRIRSENAAPGSLTELVPVLLLFAALFGMVGLVYAYGEQASSWIVPSLILSMVTLGVVNKVKVYEVFVEGAKEGFNLAVMIIPYLIAILAAVGMFRASGLMERVATGIGWVTEPLGLPAEALPLALLRPLSGSGGFGLTAELIETHGPDSYLGNLVSTMNGSTDTTFYVIAVYFGSVGVSRIRHGVAAGLTADFFGVVGSILAVNLLLGAT